MGRPSPRKDQHTRKAEQVSWLAAWLTLCAFPSLSGQSGTQGTHCISPVRAAMGPGQSGRTQAILPDCPVARVPEYPRGGTVACADFNAAYSCGAAMASPSPPAEHHGARDHHFPSEVPRSGTTQPRLFSCPKHSSSSAAAARSRSLRQPRHIYSNHPRKSSPFAGLSRRRPSGAGVAFRPHKNNEGISM